jgi:hypothetical protein
MINANTRIVLALTAGLCIGGGIGFIVAERKVRRETEEEIAEVRDMFRRLRAEDQAKEKLQSESASFDEAEDFDGITPESLAEKAVTLGYVGTDDTVMQRRDPNYRQPEPQDAGDEDFPPDDQIDQDLRQEVEYVKQIRVVNPDREVDPDDVTHWDRNPNEPYVITEAEYRIDAPEFEKLELTYYKEDDTLVEEDGSYIPDQNGTAGDVNLQNYFGYGSGDDHQMYIRNERIMCDFLVTLNEGSYQREVLGFEIENKMLQESKKVVRKMRDRE